MLTLTSMPDDTIVWQIYRVRGVHSRTVRDLCALLQGVVPQPPSGNTPLLALGHAHEIGVAHQSGPRARIRVTCLTVFFFFPMYQDVYVLSWTHHCKEEVQSDQRGRT